MTPRQKSLAEIEHEALDDHRLPALEVISEGFLDLTSDTLFGWQEFVYGKKVENYEEWIRSGSQAPPVSVVERTGHYALAFWAKNPTHPYVPDGGHHRSLAYYRVGQPMPVQFVAFPEELDPSWFRQVWEVRNIKDIPVR